MQLDIAHATSTFLEKVRAASHAGALRHAFEWLQVCAERWAARKFPPLEIAAIVNGWHDHLIRRAVELVLVELQDRGLGGPPAPFCWLLLGSGGRQEQTLHPDQDNALLYSATAGREQEERAFFNSLAEVAVERLAEIGYPYCPGYVMASNPRWNLSFPDWQHKIEDYASYPDWDNARYLMILADLRPIFGDKVLADQLSDWLMGELAKQRFLHYQVAHHLEERKVALDWRGRLRVDVWGEQEGRLNVKEGGYLQIVNAVRLWAVAHGLSANSTEQRIDRLQAAGVWEVAWAQEVRAALEELVRWRLWSNYVDPAPFTAAETDRLKTALKTARQLQKRTAKRFAKPRG
ncbi:MAG: DUF294 nucleotidyltransferase-like domain-containing protein [Tumebacillaceae bacterium]